MYRPIGGYRSRRISNRFETSKHSEFENQRPCSRGSVELVVFNTESYGKRPRLESVEYAGGYTVKATFHNRTNRFFSTVCRCQLVFTAGRYRLLRENKVERSKTSDGFIDFYIFKCHHGEEIRLKYYAGMVLIEF